MDDDRDDDFSTDVFINPALCLCSCFLLLIPFYVFIFPSQYFLNVYILVPVSGGAELPFLVNSVLMVRNLYKM